MLRTKMEEELRCPACKRWFQSPLLLPCGHSMCTPCAAHALQSAEEASGAALSGSGGAGGASGGGGGGGDGPDIDGLSVVSEADSGVVCASSRPGSYVSSTSLGNIFLQVVQAGEQAVYGLVCLICRKCALIGERGVDALPRNRALEHIVEKFSQDATQSRARPCQLCEEKEERPATTLCEQCEIFYCDACLQRCHPARGPLAKHCLHPVAEGAEIIRKKRSGRQARCAEHRQEPLSLYCLSCRGAVCCVCIQEGHSRHEVQPLNTMCKGQKADLSQILQSVSEKAKRGTEFIQNLKKQSEKINSNSNLFEAEISAQMDVLIASLEAKKTALLDQIRNEKDHKTRQYKEQISHCTSVLSKTTSLLQFCIEMLKESDTSAFLMVSHSLISRAGYAEQTFNRDMEFRPRVSNEFEMKINVEALERSIEAINFYEYKDDVESDFFPETTNTADSEAPNPPIILPEECSAEGNTVTVVWQPYPGNLVDHYTLEIDDGAQGTFKKVYRGSECICTVEGLHFKCVYRARVKAHNHAGESAYSECVCLQTADLAWFTFDPSNVTNPSDFIFSNSNFTLSTHSNEDRSILGGVGLSRGVHYWEFSVDRCDANAQPAFGVARFDCAKDGMLGRDARAWSMYVDTKRSWFMHANEHFERTDGGIRQGSVIGVRLDCDKGQLSYYLNDEPHGPIAFTDLKGILFPAVSLNRHVQLTLHTGLEAPSESEESEDDDSK